MIFRRRRTRIEIEHTTVRMEADDLRSVFLRPLAVTPPATSPVEAPLPRVLPFPAPESNAQSYAVPTTNTPAKETRS